MIKQLFLNNITVSFLIFLFLFTDIYFIQSAFFHNGIIDGLYVPDSVNYSFALFEEFKNFNTIKDIFELKYVFWGMSLLFYPFWMISEDIVFIPNLILILLSITYLYKLSHILLKTKKLYISFIIILNPYFILISTGINKEIVLLLLTLMLFVIILERKFLWKSKIILIIAFTFLFRDAYASIFLAIFLFYLFFSNNLVLGVLIAFLGASSIIVSLDVLMEYVPVIERNVQSAYYSHTDRSETFEDLVGSFDLKHYYYRVVANFAAMSVRPVYFNSDYSLNLLGIGYLVSGVFLLFSYTNVFYILLQKKILLYNYNIYLLSSLLFVSLLLVSVSLYIQPRYLFPFSPILYLLLIYILTKTELKNYKYYIFGMALLFIPLSLFLYIVGVHPPFNAVVPIKPTFVL